MEQDQTRAGTDHQTRSHIREQAGSFVRTSPQKPLLSCDSLPWRCWVSVRNIMERESKVVSLSLSHSLSLSLSPSLPLSLSLSLSLSLPLIVVDWTVGADPFCHIWIRTTVGQRWLSPRSLVYLTLPTSAST
ncbi:hypothetical protein LY78DRAFT_458675 [Colletotrichum sublineola]|nr:hypothetical protein LY78DRAFT_458675 [Colletotrichum sublineola]